MTILKHLFYSITVAALIAAPQMHARTGPYSTVTEITLSENPPSFVQSIGYVALFLATAYVLHKIVPSVPQEQNVAPEPQLMPADLTTSDALPFEEVETSPVYENYSDDF